MEQKTLFAGYIHKAPVRRIGLDDITGLHIGQSQCDQRVSLTVASADRRDSKFLPPVGKRDSRHIGILLRGRRATVAIPAELGKKVLPAGSVGETAVTVRLYLTGHRPVQKKGQRAGIIP